MKRDYTKLWERIIERYGTQRKFAAAMGWSERTTSFKLNGRAGWMVKDILRARELLDLTDKEVNEYFFEPDVQN